MNLKSKFMLITSGLVAAVVTATALYLMLAEEREWERHLTEQGISAATLTTLDLFRAYGMHLRFPRPGGREEFQRVEKDLFQRIRDLERVMILNRSGQVLYDSGQPGAPDPGGVDADRIRDIDQAVTDVRRISYGGRPCLDILSIVSEQTGPRFGVARYLISFKTLEDRLTNLRRHVLLPAGLFLLLGVAGAYGVSVRLTRPILNLEKRARVLEAGDWEPRPVIPRQDELGRLSRSFEEMAARLTEKRRDLEDRNETLSRTNTELRQLQEELVRSESLAVVGRMAVSLSHEIDNPVGVIQGFAECLLEEIPPGDPHREDVENILNESRRIRAITRGLLDLSRPVALSMAPLDLRALLEGVREAVSVRPEFRNVDWVFDVSPEAVSAEGDAEALRRVFMNLYINAAQAMEGRGRIRTEAVRDESGLSIRVIDSGPGIAQEDVERIFTPFYSTKAIGIGAGLGLSLSQRIVMSHGGTIRVESPERGGSVFTVHLPARASGQTVPAEADGIPSRTGGGGSGI